MKLKNIRYMKKVKGSVLFTVIVVMFVMLIMVTATLTLAANASNRAYSGYMRNQATYTARSAVEATIDKLNTDPNGAMSQEIMNLINTTGKATLEVSDISGGYGDIDRIEISYTGKIDNNDPTSGFYINGSEEKVIKVTAYATMGGKSVPSFSQYVTSATEDPPPGGGPGFTALGGNVGDTSTSASVIGLSGINVAQNSGLLEELKNNPTFAGLKFYNSGLNINSNAKFYLAKNENMSVWGDLYFQNYNDDAVGGVQWHTNYIPSSINDSNIPALYVDKDFTIGSNAFKFATDYPGKANPSPINIFADSITKDKAGALQVNANIYLYDNLGTSTFVAGSSALVDWYGGQAQIAGSLYSMGNVVFDLSGGSLNIPGNLYVKGNLTINGGNGLTVGGKVNVAGNINCPNGATLNGKTSKLDAAGNVDDSEIKALTDTNLIFPDDMSKDKIKDKIFNEEKAMQAAYETVMVNGKLEYKLDADGDKIPKGSKQKTEFPFIDVAAPVTYTDTVLNNETKNPAGEIEITTDCIISGSISGKKLRFLPAQNGDLIKVLLVDAEFTNDSQIIVEDNIYDADGNFFGKAMVEFYIATTDNTFKDVTATKNGVIFKGTSKEINGVKTGGFKFITKYYDENLSNPNYDIDGYPLLKDELVAERLGPEAIPAIYIYAPRKTDATITFDQSCIFTGNINAPKAKYSHSNGHNDFGVRGYLYKDGLKLTKDNVMGAQTGKKIAIIATSITINEVEQFQNDCGIYIIHNQGDSGYNEYVYKWTKSSGFANY